MQDFWSRSTTAGGMRACHHADSQPYRGGTCLEANHFCPKPCVAHGALKLRENAAGSIRVRIDARPFWQKGLSNIPAHLDSGCCVICVCVNEAIGSSVNPRTKRGGWLVLGLLGSVLIHACSKCRDTEWPWQGVPLRSLTLEWAPLFPFWFWTSPCWLT